MERKIGEIFEYNGEWYQCIPDTTDDNCNNCFFQKRCSNITGDCSSTARSDGKSVAFKKLEKVGEPHFIYDKIFEGGKVYVQNFKVWDFKNHNPICDDYVLYDWGKGIISIEIKQNKEDMEEKKQKLDKLVEDYSYNRIPYEVFDNCLKQLYVDKQIGENNPSLKEFDLEAAKAGKRVRTRDGRKARIICFDAKGKQPIIALFEREKADEEIIQTYNVDGSYYGFGKEDHRDLMMLPEKKEGWVNVYKRENEYICENECNVFTGITVYKSEGEAKRNIDKNKIYVNTIKIHWEE